MPAANQAGLGSELRMRSTGLAQSAGGAGTSTSSIRKSPFGSSATPAPFVPRSVKQKADPAPRAQKRRGTRPPTTITVVAADREEEDPHAVYYFHPRPILLHALARSSRLGHSPAHRSSLLY